MIGKILRIVLRSTVVLVIFVAILSVLYVFDVVSPKVFSDYLSKLVAGVGIIAIASILLTVLFGLSRKP